MKPERRPSVTREVAAMRDEGEKRGGAGGME